MQVHAPEREKSNPIEFLPSFELHLRVLTHFDPTEGASPLLALQFIKRFSLRIKAV